jgi:hypothetical protein
VAIGRAEAAPHFYVNCSSVAGAPKTCPFGFEAARVDIFKQLSSAACILNSTWSHVPRSVTVQSGCRAQFKVTMKVDRPRVLILTDIGQDPDDTQSLIRTLLYANDLSIEGIVATYRPSRPVASDIVRSVITAYDKDLPKLLLHDIRYPKANALLARVKDGLASNDPIGAGFDTAGSDHIIASVDASSQPLWVLVWGGSRELAQAIYKVRNTRSASSFVSFQNKLRVYSIDWSQYSAAPGNYLADNAKDMFWIVSDGYEGTRTATFRGMYLLGDTSMQRSSWINDNIKNKGNLGALYPLNTTEDGMKEGDTPTLLHLLPTGLGIPTQPSRGGWGGRYANEPEYAAISTNIYTSRYQKDELGGIVDRRASVARWRPAYQSDFAARANWLVSAYADANHPPEARIDGGTTRTLRSGDLVSLDASSSDDPDGHDLTYRWWIYRR